MNSEIYKKLEEATVTENFEEGNSILKEGMDLLTQKNKVLILSDKYGWEIAVAYGTDPVASDSEDEKTINTTGSSKAAVSDPCTPILTEGCSVGVAESRAISPRLANPQYQEI